MTIVMQNITAHLAVFDMPTAVTFYRDILGFAVIRQSGSGDDVGWCQLKCDAADVMLNTAFDSGERPPEREPGRQAAHEDTTLYIGCPDVDGAYAELRSKGVDAQPPEVSWYGMNQLYVKDPDGYLVCFQSPA